MGRYAAARLSMVHGLPDYLERHGVAPEKIFRGVGVASLSEVAEGAVVSRAQLCAALAHSARNLGDPCLGLQIGALTDPAKLGASGYALLQGRTLVECLRQHARHITAIHSDVDLTIRIDGDTAVWTHTMRRAAPGEGLDLLYEGAAAFMCKTIRALAGADWRPTLLRFPHPCRGKAAAYEDFFQAPVRFGTGTGADILFPAMLLGRQVAPIAPSAPGGGPAFDHVLEAVETAGERIVAAVRTMIDGRLGDDSLSLSQISQTLGIPLRSVQRRLADHSHTFESLLDQHRRQRAEALVSAGNASLTAIAMNLGYSDSAHFVRAFRRWTGRTPSAYLRSLSG
ncbi:AraC family transcriptional regulator [Prosthecomicrobium sp. N25]|uniref:AraC family transcriptional regulator n=1 Tax=Prosthecomicrobium sp. N25 TaxID=3129254 RepID=UPI0030777A8A